MLIFKTFKKISDQLHYYIDSFKAAGIPVKIDHFSLNYIQNDVIVIYRLGRQKLLNKMNLSQFEREYFEKVSNYDQHRLTKFATLQHILQTLFATNICDKEKLVRFIEEHIKNEQLF